MEPKKVGRTLGIGVRVASNMLRDRVEKATAAPSGSLERENGRPAAPPPPRASIRMDSRLTGAKQGAKAFGRAFLGPFTHAGSILWLEITGLFFALFALLFVQNAYRVRDAWRGGPNQLHLVLYVALAAGFVWFSASSFVRARGKSKRGPVTR